MVTGGTGRETVIIPCKIMIVFITIGILQGGIMGYFAYSHARSLIFNNKKMRWRTCWRKSISVSRIRFPT